MPEKSKFYVTTPIYYVNARPHIGHAYTTIVADVLARRHRLLGDDTFFLTGTDEHGQKIERSAAAAGIPPQKFTDQVSAEFKQLWDRMGLTYNRYIRTTDPAHKRGAQKLFTELYNRGAIYLSSYTGQYCVSEEIFVEGPPGTIGPDGKPTETVTEENFFFRLSDYQRPLIDLIESDELKITPESRKNEILSFLRGNVQGAQTTNPDTPTDLSSRPERSEVERPAVQRQPKIAYSKLGNPYVPGALRDLSVSRSSFTWGIPVPDAIQQDAGAKEKHVMYVWLDALANYITAIGYGSDDPTALAEFRRYWPADLHIMAKEITRQHCIYWPAFLLAAGLETPKQITAHGWLLFDNSKMSKSKGNIVRTETILDAFGTLCPPVQPTASTSAQPTAEEGTNSKGTASAVPNSGSKEAASGADVRPATPAERDLFAADVLRYFLLREIPFGQDGSFSFDALITRYNADLANGYGNLVSRTLTMIQQSFPLGFDRLPQRPWLIEQRGDAEDLTATQDVLTAVTALIKTCAARPLDVQTIALRLAIVDRYMSANKPWLLAKAADEQSRSKLRETLYTAAESIRIITALLYPVMPNATARVWSQLGLGDIEQAGKNGELNNLEWGGLKPGTKLGALAPIFPRAPKELAQTMADIEDSRTTTAPRPEAPLKAAATPTPAAPVSTSSSDPAAPPRTSALDEPTGPLTVGGSNAEKPTLPTTPGPHTEAPGSGPFAQTSAQPAAGNTAEPTLITIDDFMKVELRVAQILVAERIPKADKLLRLEVDLGTEKRQILSGIAQWYTPEELIGRRIVVVSNLAPRKMRGLDSHGMLLAASEGPDGKPILATFNEDIALGSRVR